MAVLRKLRRYLALPAEDRWLVARAFVALAVVDFGLRVLGYRRLADRMSRSARGRQGGPEDVARAQRYVRWLDVAARHHFVRAQCLHLSLALHEWLRREGLPSELVIGVRKDGDALQAHAWVEFGGYVVNDRARAVAPFTPLVEAAWLGRTDLDRSFSAIPGLVRNGEKRC